MSRRIAGLAVALALVVLVPVPLRAGNEVPKSALMDALDAELTRSFTALEKREAEPLYFLAYRATESKSWSASASFGALNGDSTGWSRRLDVEARVGAPELDSTHQIRGSFDFSARLQSASLPLDDDAAAVRAAAWIATDRATRTGVRVSRSCITSCQSRGTRVCGSAAAAFRASRR